MTSTVKKSDSVDDKGLVDAVRGSVEQIWQAGLGAFAKAQQEGEEIFSRLVQEGMEVQKRTQQLAGERLSGLTGTMTSMAENLGKQATGSFDKLENVFEERVSQSLQSLGVPMRDDILALIRQVGELQKSVDALAAMNKPRKTAEKATAKKTAAKSAPRKTAGAATRTKASTRKTAEAGRA